MSADWPPGSPPEPELESETDRPMARGSAPPMPDDRKEEDEDETDVAQVFALRQRYWNNGYRPVPVYSRQKRPRGNGWLADALQNPPVGATSWPEIVALSTGIATGPLTGFDVDVLIQAIVDRIVWETEQMLGVTPLVRIGRAPKTLLGFRCEHDPFRKLSTGTFIMPDGTEAKVEMLADGQQFVADGIHPDTGQPYLWPAGSPETVPLADVPPITLEQAQALVAKARELIIANGGVEKKPPQREAGRQQQTTAAGAAGFFAAVNEAALRNLAAWVKTLFPRATYQTGTGAWRVASKDRGRPDLQEDISLHPDGIQDFGCEQGLSPIDVVIEFGGCADAVAAAHWLCERLGIAPVTLGWHDAAAPDSTQRPEPDDGSSTAKPNGGATGSELQLVWANIRPITAIPPRQWAYGRFLLFGSAAVIGAVDGAGKGTIATVMALAMITGQPLLGEKVWRAGPVAIITYEDDQEEWERRFAAACIFYGLDYETIMKSVAFLTKPGGRVTLAERTARNGLIFPDTARIVHFLKDRAVLLILDPFNSAHAMEDGNNNVAIAAVAQEVTTIARAAQVAALVLHHLRKGATGSVDDLMGATSLRANFRSCRILQVMDEATAVGLGIPAVDAWRHLWVAGTKENYAPPPIDRRWFHKASVKLNNPAGIYTDGDDVGAIGHWTPPAAFEGLDYDRMRAVFDALTAKPHTRNKRATSVPWAGKPLMDAGCSEEQAKKILDLWLQSDTLVEADPVKGGSRHPVQTVKPDPAKVAAILAPLRAGGASPGTAQR